MNFKTLTSACRTGVNSNSLEKQKQKSELPPGFDDILMGWSCGVHRVWALSRRKSRALPRLLMR